MAEKIKQSQVKFDKLNEYFRQRLRNIFSSKSQIIDNQANVEAYNEILHM
jgi:hypothetical protein